MKKFWREDGTLVGLRCHLTDFTQMLLYITLIFRLEFDARIFDDSGIVLLEAMAAVFLLKARDDIFQAFVLSKQGLVLTPALDGGSTPDKRGHLFEDLAGPE